MGDGDMAVIRAAEVFLPTGIVTGIAVGALFAVATSINGILMGNSRDVYTGAKSGVLPSYFATIHNGYGTPSRAVLLIGALALPGIAIGGSVVNFA